MAQDKAGFSQESLMTSFSGVLPLKSWRTKWVWLVVIGYLLTFLLLLSALFFTNATASTNVLYVAPDADCGDASPCYATPQEAVNAAVPGDEIRLAGGIYTLDGESEQVVFLEKYLTLRGGYSISNWENPDPQATPTILDALDQGRVMVIMVDGEVSLDGLRFERGNAEGLAGGALGEDAGGALYIYQAQVTLRQSQVNNSRAVKGLGGGIFVRQSPLGLRMEDCQVKGNLAKHGGGIYLYQSNATIESTLIQENSAGDGGGISSRLSSLTLLNSFLVENSANLLSGSLYGGGLWLDTSNTPPSLIRGNLIQRNRAGDGGGINILGDDLAVIEDNLIIDNEANAIFYHGHGGGLYLDAPGVRLERNQIQRNLAVQGSYSYSRAYGGGLVIRRDSVLSNNIIAENRVSGDGAVGPGVYVQGASPIFYHNTLANNTGGEGSGLYVIEEVDKTPADPVLYNTIIAHQEVGVYVSDGVAGNMATLAGVLWWENLSNDQGQVLISDEVSGDPLFLDVPNYDYHVSAGSAAIDQSPASFVELDIDQEPRLNIPDLGADEYWAPGKLTYLYLPLVVKE